jgi:hypothetical protein
MKKEGKCIHKLRDLARKLSRLGAILTTQVSLIGLFGDRRDRARRRRRPPRVKPRGSRVLCCYAAPPPPYPPPPYRCASWGSDRCALLGLRPELA